MKRREMKNNNIPSVSVLGILIAFIMSLSVAGQQSEVRVVKPYSPTLSGANKVQLLPSLDEEIEYDTPALNYQLYPKLYDSEFRVEPIKAARMVKMPLKKLYKSELTLGIGNYITPLAELNINQLRSRNGTLGFQLKHHSMNGKLKLNDELKVPAGFSENSAKLYGSRFMKSSVIDYRVGAGYNSFVHYGVDTTVVTESELVRDSLKHPYFLAEANLGMHSMNADSFHFNYDAGLDYYFFTHRFDEAEHGAKLSFRFDKALRVVDIAGEAGGAFYGHYPDWDQTIGNHTMVWLNPHVAKNTSEWKFTAGFNTYLSFAGDTAAGDIQPFHLYPRASFEFDVVKEVIVPYFGVDGYLESNNYRKTVEENPYVLPTLSVKPTSHKLIGTLGVKGRITDGFAYNFKGSYSIIDNQYFFVNDTSQLLRNQFSVVYSDITLLNLQAELTFRPGDSWKIFLKGNYYRYTLSTMSTAGGTTRNVRDDDHPWNKPAFDASLQARYNMSDKILVSMGIYTIGKRYYEDFDSTLEETLPLTVDANLGLEYRYSKLLSFWLRINNLAAQKYYLYNQYPAYRFRAMVGFTYSL
ncbi:MAG: hypothetical protein V2B15_20460 [Bacteroidota bacterium]